MSYQVLARKWRPQHFSQLVGQEHVKNALSNALTNNRLHHAYLFTGTRGVGKTTIARIFAKSLNCELGITASPCGECTACREIDAGNFVDLMEIDAASRTKVEDTRDLLDNVQYAPSRGRFKVYLIDEVHMLSKHSFNALLKTLEEPPPHVKFLLATTDPQKLPITVLSRCLQFNLLALSPTQIAQHLAYVLTEENIPFVEPALNLIAKAAKGSLRDSLSLTDQAIAQSNSDIQLDVIRTMLGYLEQSWAEQLLQAVLAQDAVGLQQQLATLVQQHNDYAQVLDDMLSILHLTALSQFTPAAAAISESADFILQLAQRLEPAQVQLYYQLLISGKKELAYAPDALIGLEMALLRAMAFAPASVNLVSGISQPSHPNSAVEPVTLSSHVASKTDALSTVEPSTAESSTAGSNTAMPKPVAQPMQTPELPAQSLAQASAPAITASPVAHSQEVLAPDTPEASQEQQRLPIQPMAIDAIVEPQQPAIAPNAGIDSVTSGIMARRGISLEQNSRAAEKKIERPLAPRLAESAVTVRPEASPALPQSQANSKAQMPQPAMQQPVHSPSQLPTQAATPNRTAPAQSAVIDDAGYNDAVAGLNDEPNYEANYEPNDEPNDELAPFDNGQADAMWQQYQAETPPLTEFDGSINQQNFSIKFAAQVDAWAARIEQLDTGGLSRLFLLNAAISLQGENMQLSVAKSQQHLDDAEFRQNLQQLLEHSFNQRLQLQISYHDEVADSPLAIQQRIVAERRVYVHKLLQQDDNVIQFQQLFAAQMLEDTIQVN
ncbi:DNA polymerase III subunit gamma/tau [Rheinheimera salexigens]|uniref:DNA polymerase III subunit gamma/tau n=1 Tax=Rheinheimera salexigens TaxID=1628148 RepID=A0A1E7Q8X0_9GAMM|nr:DNA polymerase III subunit gamma/tau [Rheinheimera salexigens]OEY70541.1 DNA polymerase III, subunit gamma and tau [Rheinheimera salexigens]